MRAFIQGIRLPVIAVALQALTLAAQLQAPPPLPTRKNQIISGIVVNAITGDPIRRALVEFSGESSALTDGDGHFKFQIPANVQGLISARKPGFFNDQQISQGEYLASLMAGGANSKPMVVRLTPESVIFGQVNSEAGPIEGITVTAVASILREGRRVWGGATASTTDEDGTFRIANLLPGAYYLSVGPSFAPNLLASGTPPRARGYAKWFFPGVPELSAATPLEVAAGQQVQADLTPRLVSMFNISGNIAGVPPGGGLGLQFQTAAGELSAFNMRFDESTGNFHARVPAGSYVMKARAQPANDREVSGADLPISVTSDLRGISLALVPMMPIPINVHTVGEDDPATGRGQFNMLRASQDGLPINLKLVKEPSAVESPEYFSQFAGEGKDQILAFVNVEPGRYRVEFSVNGPWYLAEALSGNTDVLRDPLEIHSGARTPPIEVELRHNGGEIQATIPSEESSWVLLASPRSAAENQARQVPAGGRGVFQFVAPGEYSLLAFDNIDGIEYKNADALSEFMGKAVHVVLDPGQQLETSVEIIHRTR